MFCCCCLFVVVVCLFVVVCFYSNMPSGGKIFTYFPVLTLVCRGTQVQKEIFTELSDYYLAFHGWALQHTRVKSKIITKLFL